MKRIIIQNLGPIKEADISLRDINVIIGEQSIGKSCVLKVACFCTWVEKRIEIDQNAKRFEKKGGFFHELVNFHRLEGYIHRDTFIYYESDHMIFSFNEEKGFHYEWKVQRWEYKRPKVSYIPAERNLVAVIPNWFEVKSVAANIQDFMADWSEARKVVGKDTEILNLKVAYHYEESSDSDLVKLDDGNFLPFANVSSGLQSLIPLYILIVYLTGRNFRNKEDNSVKHKSEEENLIKKLRKFYSLNIGPQTIETPAADLSNEGHISVPNPKMTIWLIRKLMNLTKTNHCEVFLEEPEENLFPPTQQILMRSLMDYISQDKGNTLFISTHSPYILDIFLEREKYDFGMFYIQPSENGSVVKTATEADVQEMYDAGIDAFFNIERLGDEIR